MKWSKFIFKRVDLDSVTLVNTMNEAIVDFPISEYQLINDCIERNYQISNSEYKSEINKLIEMDFIIEDGINENSKLNEIVNNTFINDDNMKIVLMTTSCCNFSCEYCYENGIDRTEKLKLEVIESLIQYLRLYHKENPKVKKLNISLFGGEPTLNWGATKEAIVLLNDYCKENDLMFSVDIITNGYLLNKEKFDFLRKYNLKDIQITLDGTAEVHDKRRFIKNGKPTFYKIIENLHYALDSNALNSIYLRINFDSNNADNILILLEYLSKEFDVNKLNLSFGEITSTVENSSSNIFVANHRINEEQTIEWLFKFYLRAKNLGFKLKEFYCPDGYCIAKTKHSFVLYPNGDMYKCLSMVGRKTFAFGNIKNIKTKMVSYYSQGLFLQCSNKNCEYLPVCHSGCRFDSYIKNGDIYNTDCKYQLISKANNKLLKLFV